MTADRLTIPLDRQPERLDKVLSAMAGVGSRARAKAALERGKVTVNGVQMGAADGGSPVNPGDVLELDWNRPGTSAAHAKARAALPEADLKVLFEDEDLLAVDKPVGLLTDAADREQQLERDTVKKRLITYLRPHGLRPWVCHRIDRDTSGVVLFAKTEAMQESVMRQFRAREPMRVYLTMVQGVPPGQQGEWVDVMRWDHKRRIQEAKSGEGAVEARSHWTLVERFPKGFSLLEVRLTTGRRNQIRLQCQLRGHPLIGESLYLPDNWRSRFSFPRQALHAHRLGLVHPRTGKPLVIECPLPPDLLALSNALRNG